MISTKIRTTAHIPSGFAMPISGATFLGTGHGMTAGAICAAPTYIVRDRDVVDVPLAQGAVPGPTAWSPPIC